MQGLYFTTMVVLKKKNHKLKVKCTHKKYNFLNQWSQDKREEPRNHTGVNQLVINSKRQHYTLHTKLPPEDRHGKLLEPHNLGRKQYKDTTESSSHVRVKCHHLANPAGKHFDSHQKEMRDVEHDTQLHTDKQLEENHKEQNLLGKHERRDSDQRIPDIIRSQPW